MQFTSSSKMVPASPNAGRHTLHMYTLKTFLNCYKALGENCL